MATLTPVDFDPFASAPAQSAPQGVGPDGVLRVTVSPRGREPKLTPVDYDPFAPKMGVAEDVGLSALSGVGKGVAGLVGLPDSVNQLADYGVRQTVGRVVNAVRSGGQDWSADQSPRPQSAADALSFPSAAGTQRAIETVTGEFHKPQTTAGQYAQTAGEFLPGAAAVPVRAVGQAFGNMLRYGVAPGITSEGAGQATKGTAFEAPARIAGGLFGAGAASLASRPGRTAQIIRDQMPEGVTPQMVDSAQGLIVDAAQQGIALSWPEALSQVAGRPVLTNTMRHLEASPQTEAQMSQFFGRRPQEVDTASRGVFDRLAPVNNNPSSIGPDASAVARQVVRETPQGRSYDEALFQSGPRTSPGDAGAVIQSDLRRVYEGREGMRAALGDRDYTAARNAPATVPTNGDFRVADVTKTYLDRPDIPIILNDAERQAARVRWLDENSQTRPTPIIGERPTQFQQVDAAPVVSYLDAALDSAKGAVRQGLQAARSALFKPDGQIDGSVAGLHNSRMAITDLIDQAKMAGANNTVRELQSSLSILDDVLERVPAYGQARRYFKAASEPLKPFDDGRVPGRIVELDQYGNRPVMPTEQVPLAIERGGATAARDFNQVATPQAREAFESHLITQVLDRARGTGADLSAGSIRNAIRQNEDLLREFPGVRSRLEAVAGSKDALESVMTGPIGKLAKRDATTRDAINALFPQNPLANSANEISQTIGALAKKSPRVASDLVRVHMESVFNQASRELISGANSAGGAKFRAALVGNPQQAANLEAAVRALPHGDQVWPGIQRFLDVLEATGTRQNVGSRTAYNAIFSENLSKSGMIGEGSKALANPLQGAKFLADKFENWKLGKNLDELARVFTDPKAANLFRAISKRPVGNRAAQQIAVRIGLLTNAAYQH